MAIQPIGSIVAYAGASAPAGWLLCNGDPIPAGKAYDEIRKLVGPKAPDLRGYFLRGLDTSGNVDPDKTRKLLQPQADGVGPHAHKYSNWYHGGAGKSGAGSPDMPADRNDGPTGAPEPTPGETRPKNIAVNFMIKATDEG